MNASSSSSLVCALASLGAGCIYDAHGNRGGGGDDYAQITATWQLQNMADGAITACPSGFTTAAVISQPVDDAQAPAGEPYIDLFDCGANLGETAALAPDRYLAWVEIQTDDGARTYAQSLSQLLDARDTDARLATTILNDGGYFQLAWSLVGAQSNAPLGCADVAGLTAIRATSSTATAAYDDTFPCEDHADTTAGIAQGAYRVTLEAMRGERAAGTAPPLSAKIIDGPNRVTDLGHIMIPIADQ